MAGEGGRLGTAKNLHGGVSGKTQNGSKGNFNSTIPDHLRKRRLGQRTRKQGGKHRVDRAARAPYRVTPSATRPVGGPGRGPLEAQSPADRATRRGERGARTARSRGGEVVGFFPAPRRAGPWEERRGRKRGGRGGCAGRRGRGTRGLTHPPGGAPREQGRGLGGAVAGADVGAAASEEAAPLPAMNQLRGAHRGAGVTGKPRGRAAGRRLLQFPVLPRTLGAPGTHRNSPPFGPRGSARDPAEVRPPDSGRRGVGAVGKKGSGSGLGRKSENRKLRGPRGRPRLGQPTPRRTPRHGPGPIQAEPGACVGCSGQEQVFEQISGTLDVVPVQKLPVNRTFCSKRPEAFLSQSQGCFNKACFSLFFLKKAIPSWRYIVHIQGL